MAERLLLVRQMEKKLGKEPPRARSVAALCEM